MLDLCQQILSQKSIRWQYSVHIGIHEGLFPNPLPWLYKISFWEIFFSLSVSAITSKLAALQGPNDTFLSTCCGSLPGSTHTSMQYPKHSPLLIPTPLPKTIPPVSSLFLFMIPPFSQSPRLQSLVFFLFLSPLSFIIHVCMNVYIHFLPSILTATTLVEAQMFFFNL